MNDSLSYVEKKINYRIQELKDKMEKTNLRAETDRLWVRIETLQWLWHKYLHYTTCMINNTFNPIFRE
jgi:hypothetical protein